jgi:hypothetical protein
MFLACSLSSQVFDGVNSCGRIAYPISKKIRRFVPGPTKFTFPDKFSRGNCPTGALFARQHSGITIRGGRFKGRHGGRGNIRNWWGHPNGVDSLCSRLGSSLLFSSHSFTYRVLRRSLAIYHKSIMINKKIKINKEPKNKAAVVRAQSTCQECSESDE